MSVGVGVVVKSNVASASLLVTRRSGAASTGVLSLPELLVWLPSGSLSAEMVAVLATWATPAGSVLSTVTANVTLPVAPGARMPTS